MKSVANGVVLTRKANKMMVQLNPPIPLNGPKGACLAHFLIDYGMESDLYWVTFDDATGEIWTWNNKDVRAQKNITLGRVFKDKMDKMPNCS